MPIYDVKWGIYGVDDFAVKLWHGFHIDRLEEIPWTVLPDPNPSQSNIDMIEEIINPEWIKIMRHNQLDTDDPDRISDPDLDSRFWCSRLGTRDPDGNYICYKRGHIEVAWDVDRPGYRGKFVFYRVNT